MTDVTHYPAQDLEALGDLVNYQSWILRWLRPNLRGRVKIGRAHV